MKPLRKRYYISSVLLLDFVTPPLIPFVFYAAGRWSGA
jgi:hypothetical protein